MADEDMLTKATVQAAIAAMRTALPGASVTVTIRGIPVAAIERRGTQDAEASGMGVFPGQVGHFILTGTPPEGMRDGDTITVSRSEGNDEELRIVGLGRPYDGVVRVYYGDKHTRGRVG